MHQSKTNNMLEIIDECFRFLFQLQISSEHFQENITWNRKKKKIHGSKTESRAIGR